MTKHNMPVLTEDRRLSLIEWAEGYIEAAERSVENNPLDVSAKAYLELLQISYTALTADPAAFRYAYLPTVGEEGNWHYVDSEHEASQSSGYVTQKLYTAPPVPALKLPDESDLDPGALVGLERRINFMNGARFAIAETERLNGVTE